MNNAALSAARAGARTWWQGLAGRERRLVLAAALLVGGALLWAVALAPALRTLATAPARLADRKSVV